MSRLSFKLEAEASNSNARASTFTTLHGEVQTPIFMPVGTQATVKAIHPDILHRLGSNVLLANTYHLLLRPGIEVFKKFGGIHRFMNWQKPVLTDSGGFQIFSLPHSRNMTEEGAQFQSYVDGSTILLSPEKSIATQRAINSDIMMVLDQCVPSTVPHQEAQEAMELTHRWAVRSLAAREDSQQSMFGIIQGACYPDLRKRSAEYLATLPFDGFAIGGLAVGEGKNERNDFCELTAAMMPKNLPRYLMGVGTPLDLLEAVHRGVDMFDCILPVEQAQRGVAFTSRGKYQLRRTVYKFSEDVLDPGCTCSTCQVYSKAYLHHLTKTQEVLGWQLLATHNLHFYHRLMESMRAHILADTFADYYKTMGVELDRNDEENPAIHRGKTPRSERKKHLGDYELQESACGTWWSVRQRSSGEVMHSVSNPAEEARRLYVEQTRLSERLCGKGSGNIAGELLIWDVGLGAASNAMAAIYAWEEMVKTHGLDAVAKLHIESFEIDLDPLRLALKHSGRFPQLYHQAPRMLLAEGAWAHPSGKLTWKLREGDFMETMKTSPLPDLVFYDPFSAKVDGPLWTENTFGQIAKRLDELSVGMATCLTRLYTYSNSTAIRTNLLRCGFWVGSGLGTGPKSETTLAWYKPVNKETLADSEQMSLLGKPWLDRRSRSHHRYPDSLPFELRANYDESIVTHPQMGDL